MIEGRFRLLLKLQRSRRRSVRAVGRRGRNRKSRNRLNRLLHRILLNLQHPHLSTVIDSQSQRVQRKNQGESEERNEAKGGGMTEFRKTNLHTSLLLLSRCAQLVLSVDLESTRIVEKGRHESVCRTRTRVDKKFCFLHPSRPEPIFPPLRPPILCRLYPLSMGEEAEGMEGREYGVKLSQ